MAENKLLDDIAKFGNSTLTAVGSMQKQFRKWSSEQIDIAIKNTELVTKRELESLHSRIRELETRIDHLEGKTGTKAKPAKTKAKKS